MSENDHNEQRAAELAEELARALDHPVVHSLTQRLVARPAVDALNYTGAKLAAVAALVRIDDRNAAEVLFIKRAVLERDPWSGHVAFPGGRYEPGDESLGQTAVRETREELSMDIARYGKIIGRLDDLAPSSPALPPVIVRPFVAIVPATLSFAVSTSEVADAFWVPVSVLRSPESRTQYLVTRGGLEVRFPAYGVFGHVIWGLTERIVTQLLPLFGEAD